MPQQGMTDLSRLRKRPLEADAATSARAAGEIEHRERRDDRLQQSMAHLDAEIAQAFGLADAGQLQQLRRVERTGTDHDLTRRPSFTHLAGDGIADAGAALPVEHQPFGQSLRLDLEVPAAADRIEIAP